MKTFTQLIGALVFSLLILSSQAQEIITGQYIELSTPDNGYKEYKAQQEVHLKNGYQFSADANNSMHAYVDESLVLPTDYVSAYNDATFSNSVINTNLTVGATPGSAGVSPSGAATYSIPIAIPKGTNGMKPSISVTYNSQSGNGILGYGWHISGLSAISRAGKTHYHNGQVSPVTLSNQDRFMLDGQYLIPISGENGADGTEYRTEAESYAKITSIESYNGCPKYFKVEHKNGLIFYYGSVSASRNTLANNKFLSYHLYKVIDKHDNYMTYHYTNEGGQFRIEKIRYTANDSHALDYHSEVNFFYSERSDQSEGYVSGNKLTTKYLLREIQTKTNGKLFRAYHFEHSYNTYSYLKTVTEQGAFGEQLNTTKFKYDNDDSFGIDFGFIPGGGMLSNNREYFAGDFNGDGLQDLLCLRFNKNGNESRCMEWGVFLNKNYGNTSGFEYHQMPLPGILNADGLFREVSERFPNGVNILIGDLNGDGKDDIVVGAKGVYSSNGSNLHKNYFYYKGYLSSSNSLGYSFINTEIQLPFDDYHTPLISWNSNVEKRHAVSLGDFDGDGRKEFFGINNATLNLKINSFDTRIQAIYEIDSDLFDGEWSNLHTIDWDRDGEDEIIFLTYEQENTREYWMDIEINGNNLSVDNYYFNALGNDESKLLNVGDFNGDGLADLLKKVDGQHKLYINKGLAADQNFNYGMFEVMNVSNSMFSEADEMFYQDINLDGKTDIVRITLNSAIQELPGIDAVVNPESASVKVYLAGVQPMSFNYVQSSISPSSISMHSIEFLNDFTGDGIADVFGACLFNINPSQNSCTQRMKAYELFDADKAQLNTIKDGLNNEISFDYNKLTDYDNYSKTANWGNYPRLNFSSPLSVVSAIHSPNGLGGTNTTNYFYKDAILHNKGKGFLGFQQTTIENETTGSKTESYNAFHPSWHVAYPTLSKSYLNGELISESETDYYFNDLGNQRYSILPKTTTATHHLQGVTTIKDFEWSPEGNLTYEKTNVHNGLEVMEGHYEYEQQGSHTKNVRTSAQVIRTRAGQDPFEFSTQYAYYTNGALKEKLDFYGTPKQVKTDFQYDDFGNIKRQARSSESLPTGVSRYYYDATARFLTKEVNPLGYTTLTDYHPRYGRPISSKDILGKTTTYDYNAFGTLVKTTMPNGEVMEQQLEWDESDDYLFKKREVLNGYTLATTWHDVLGREVKQKIQGLNQDVWTTTSYNDKGQVAQQSTPHFEGDNALITSYVYDDFGRVQTVNSPVGVSTTSYSYADNLFKTTVVSPQGTVSSTTDASGKVIKKEDEGGEVSFTYYSHGQQKAVLVNGQELASMDYDGYGRQTALHDANAGSTVYEYNAYGELISQTDAKGQTTTMDYDVLGRVLSKTSPEGLTDYSYHNNGYGKGQLKKVTAPNGSFESYDYDSWGRLSQLTEHIDGTDYTTAYNYNNKHQLTKTTYPTGFFVSNTYDNKGYLQSVKANGNQLIFTAQEQNALGQYTSYKYANGMNVEKTYNSFGMPSNYFCEGIQDMTFDFDSETGNLNSRSDHLKGLHESFDYDGLQRLTQHIRPYTGESMDVSLADLAEGYSYFDNGNIKRKTDVSAQDYQYHPTKPHALVGVNNVIDPLASLQEQIIDYNSAQDPISISENGYTLNFEYGPHNNRVRSVLSHNDQVQQTKTYLSTMEILQVGDTTTHIHYIAGGDGLAAMYVEKEGEEGNYYFAFKDYLGSILTLADKDGNTVQEQSFDAWGRYRNTEDWSYENVSPPTLANGDFTWLRGYTGHEYLPQFSLIHMNGRLYDPYLGRMLSPDNFVHSDFGTQGYNRYSYANNNPLKYTDPSGENPILFAVALGMFISDYTGRKAGLEGSELLVHIIKGGVISGMSAGVGGWAGGVVAGSLGAGSTLAGAIVNGAISGAVGGFAGGFVVGAGNAWMGGASFGQGLEQGLIGGGIGALGGAVFGGIAGGVQYNRQITLFQQGCETLGVEGGDAVPATDKFLLDAQQTWYKDAPMDKVGNFTTENVPAGLQLKMDQAGASGATRALSNKSTGLLTGRSNVYFNKNLAFSSAKQLYFTMGHELVHVSQYAALVGQPTSILRQSFVYNGQIVRFNHDLMEFHAYSYQNSLGGTQLNSFPNDLVQSMAKQWPSYFNMLKYTNFGWTGTTNYIYPF